jgi:PKD repeat protein/Mg-chelatase subunit ChlD
MRTTSCAARGRPLAALLFFIMVCSIAWAAQAGASVEVQQELDLDEVFVAGLGEEPTRANLALTLRGAGPAGGYPADCVLIIDTSATADLASAKSFALDLIDQFPDGDRIALVSYATTARLDVPLTGKRTELKTAIADLSPGGKSALGLGMQMARRELLNNGREDAILVEILLADGQSNVGVEPTVEGEVAAESGIVIVSVGIGPLINRNLMEAFAGKTDGLFFQRPSERSLTQIVEHLVRDVAATEIRIDKRLPAGLRLVSASPNPSRVETLSDGTTSVVWRVAELLLAQELVIEVEVEATEKGVWDSDVDSLVTYADFRGVEGSVSVPPLKLLATKPNRIPVAMFAYEPEKGATTLDTVEFSDLSFDPESDGRIVSWEWDFGDGAIGSERDPRHRYAESGVYTVRMRVIDDRGGVSADAVSQISIGDPPPPVAMFAYSPTAPTTADVVGFIDRSFAQDEDTEITGWEWDFGDGSVGNEQSPRHRYAESGVYTVRMRVIDDRGGVSADVVSHISIGDPPPPVAMFAYAPTAPTTADIVGFVDRSFPHDEDTEITSWEWDFGDGSVSREQSPEHRFATQGTFRVQLTVADTYGATSEIYAVDVTIGNTPPFASFEPRGVELGQDVGGAFATPDQPRVGVEILLDASGSYDLDNSIEWYMWDFDGDGVVDKTTETSEVSHTFRTPGEHRVILTVVDSKGAQAAVEKRVNVIATVTTLRTIETGLPDDGTIPSGVVHVTLSLGLNTTVNGLSVTETIPVGWTFASIESDGATMRQDGQTIEWLFLEKFASVGGNSRREIRYTLTAPDTVGETQQATITGKLGSSSPRVTQTIAGDDRVTVLSVLSIPVVISRWDVVAKAIDPYLGETIGFDQIQYAVSLWVSGATVPYTNDMTITLTRMQDLIAYWLTGSSVHDPLP